MSYVRAKNSTFYLLTSCRHTNSVKHDIQGNLGVSFRLKFNRSPNEYGSDALSSVLCRCRVKHSTLSSGKYFHHLKITYISQELLSDIT